MKQIALKGRAGLKLFLCSLLLLNVQCMEYRNQVSITVEKILSLDSLPSGSGLAVVEDKIYICGDDSPYLFHLSTDYQISGKHLLLKDFDGTSRIAKKDKPDFESITVAEWQSKSSLLIFGSGSKSPQRDWLVIAPLQELDKPQFYSLTSFYNAIAAIEGNGREAMNIEGAVQVGRQLWLLNRGSNTIITIQWDEFSGYLQNGIAAGDPLFQLHRLKLPEIDGKQARFSGACEVPGTNKILFTATVEDTDNWIDDGEILGSYVGLLNGSSVQQEVVQQSWLITDKDGETMKVKLESIDVLKLENSDLKVLAIADNDAGSTELLELQLKNFSSLIR